LLTTGHKLFLARRTPGSRWVCPIQAFGLSKPLQALELLCHGGRK
jgi:hypothetical protein